jgi:hypothetical protein
MDDNESTANPNNQQAGVYPVADLQGTEEAVGENNKAREGRDEQGRWIKGVSGNPDGAEPWTEEEKLAKRATKQIIEAYKNKLAEALPKIEPVLVGKALEGDINAIKEINDRVMGKSKNVVIGGDDDDPAIKIKQIYGGISKRISDEEGILPEETNPSSDGGDIS